MCGICGILTRPQGIGAEPVDQRRLEILRDAQRHRGPDDAGIWISDNRSVGLAHRRLSIIDLSAAGHQPMATEDGQLRVVFNGEIYNYRELRSTLIDRGHRFRTESDTEVLLHGYREWGLELLDRLGGMFAFALYDAKSKETLLARDPLGIKPLYYAEHGQQLVFASEIQALRKVLDDGGPDPEGIVSFLSWGSIAPPRTLYRQIRALPSGSWMRWTPRGLEGPNTYWTIESEFGHEEKMDWPEASERLRTALVDTARRHTIADVPVGAFLSGGVDSVALVGLLSETHPEPIRTVTLAFDVASLDESALARQAATLYGAEHYEVPIGVDEIRDRMPDAIRSLDQPSIDGVNTYFVSEAAARTGLKVAISGIGGDELFGGYLTFNRIPQIMSVRNRLSRLPGVDWLSRNPDPWLARTTHGKHLPKLMRALVYGKEEAGAYFTERGLFSPPEIRALLTPEIAEAVDACEPRESLTQRLALDSIPPEERISALEIRQYLQVQLLRDTDITSMRHSLEVRTPLVDLELLRAAVKVPARFRRAGPAKRALREAPSVAVPDAVWNRRKQGFTLPFDTWLREGSIPSSPARHPLIRTDAQDSIASAFSSGQIHWSRLWALIVLGEFLN
jgi:asparagine synthase (glutamine-hydrolysing)